MKDGQDRTPPPVVAVAAGRIATAPDVIEDLFRPDQVDEGHEPASDCPPLGEAQAAHPERPQVAVQPAGPGDQDGEGGHDQRGLDRCGNVDAQAAGLELRHADAVGVGLQTAKEMGGVEVRSGVEAGGSDGGEEQRRTRLASLRPERKVPERRVSVGADASGQGGGGSSMQGRSRSRHSGGMAARTHLVPRRVSALCRSGQTADRRRQRQPRSSTPAARSLSVTAPLWMASLASRTRRDSPASVRMPNLS